jgi:hypothetical protein
MRGRASDGNEPPGMTELRGLKRARVRDSASRCGPPAPPPGLGKAIGQFSFYVSESAETVVGLYPQP